MHGGRRSSSCIYSGAARRYDIAKHAVLQCPRWLACCYGVVGFDALAQSVCNGNRSIEAISGVANKI
jgi:hypothetical protein